MADMPVDLSSYNVVVLESYLACEPSYEPAIRDHISNGGARAWFKPRWGQVFLGILSEIIVPHGVIVNLTV